MKEQNTRYDLRRGKNNVLVVDSKSGASYLVLGLLMSSNISVLCCDIYQVSVRSDLCESNQFMLCSQCVSGAQAIAN